MNTETATQHAAPKYSPWGAIQQINELAPGIWSVSTASHGGIYVAPELYAKMPEVLKGTAYSGGGWFEEDCDWAIPYAWFCDRIAEAGYKPDHVANIQAAIDTLRNHYNVAVRNYFVRQ
jgi:hypothetical protein